MKIRSYLVTLAITVIAMLSIGEEPSPCDSASSPAFPGDPAWPRDSAQAGLVHEMDKVREALRGGNCKYNWHHVVVKGLGSDSSPLVVGRAYSNSKLQFDVHSRHNGVLLTIEDHAHLRRNLSDGPRWDALQQKVFTALCVYHLYHAAFEGAASPEGAETAFRSHFSGNEANQSLHLLDAYTQLPAYQSGGERRGVHYGRDTLPVVVMIMFFLHTDLENVHRAGFYAPLRYQGPVQFSDNRQGYENPNITLPPWDGTSSANSLFGFSHTKAATIYKRTIGDQVALGKYECFDSDTLFAGLGIDNGKIQELALAVVDPDPVDQERPFGPVANAFRMIYDNKENIFKSTQLRDSSGNYLPSLLFPHEDE